MFKTLSKLAFVKKNMIADSSWIVALLFTFLAGLSQVNGADIGYHCQSDLDCQAGNGGQYSRCNNYSSVCVCTHDYLGNENRVELDKDRKRCNHTNECNRVKGCNITCLQEDEDTHGCETVIFCSNEANCSVGCAPRELWMWDTNKDWYWTIPKLVSDFIPEIKTSVCYDPDRAVHSRPEGMVIKTSNISGAGLGVFTEKYLERGTLIGPYKGIRVYGETFNEDMSWTIKTPNSEWKVDARDPSLSNWVRYINNPIYPDLQNLAPVCHEGEMYYLVFKSIQPGSELLVWYGDGYAAKLGIKKYKKTRYAYGKDGFIGGRCLGRQFQQMYGVRCYIENAVCMSVVCLCKTGSHMRGGECINDETVGGRCYSKNGNACQKDENAICRNGVCFCNDNSTQMNKKCVYDETYGGICKNLTGDCALDRNAECAHGICQCKYGTTEVSGKCVTDETVGGVCIETQGQECLLDNNALCIGGSCVCKKGTNQVGQKCQRDGSLRGFCKAGKCAGKNVVCSIKTKICVCETGYKENGGKCVN